MNLKYWSCLFIIIVFIPTLLFSKTIDENLDGFLYKCKKDGLQHFILVKHPNKNVAVIIATSRYIHPASISLKYVERYNLYSVGIIKNAYCSLFFVIKSAKGYYYSSYVPSGYLDFFSYYPKKEVVIGGYDRKLFPILRESTYRILFFSRPECSTIRPVFKSFDSWGLKAW